MNRLDKARGLFSDQTQLGFRVLRMDRHRPSSDRRSVCGIADCKERLLSSTPWPGLFLLQNSAWQNRSHHDYSIIVVSVEREAEQDDPGFIDDPDVRNWLLGQVC